MHIVQRDLADIDASQPHRALLRIPEAGDQIRHGRLTRAAWPDQGEHRAFLEVDRYVVEHGSARLIGEGHVIERDVVVRVLGNPRRRLVPHIDRCIQDLEDPVGRGLGVSEALELPV